MHIETPSIISLSQDLCFAAKVRAETQVPPSDWSAVTLPHRGRHRPDVPQRHALDAELEQQVAQHVFREGAQAASHSFPVSHNHRTFGYRDIFFSVKRSGPALVGVQREAAEADCTSKV